MDDLGLPGEYPYTRGIQPSMYRGRLWTMRQYAGFGTAAESQRALPLSAGPRRHRLERRLRPADADGLRLGPSACGRRGRPGRRRHRLDSTTWRRCSTGIPLDRVSTSMTINATAIILLALYIAVARRQGVPPSKLSGTIQNDILKEYVARGTYIYPPRASLRIVTDIFAFCTRELAQLEQHFDQRLSHPRGGIDGGPGGGVHVRERDRLRAARRSRPGST